MDHGPRSNPSPAEISDGKSAGNEKSYRLRGLRRAGRWARAKCETKINSRARHVRCTASKLDDTDDNYAGSGRAAHASSAKKGEKDKAKP